MRKAKHKRTTKETDIRLELSLDGTGEVEIDTGLGFLDHMLTHLTIHGLFDLQLTARGDLEVDEHHTVEDCALALGQAFDQALGDRKGITRMGSAFVPMDETLAQVIVDLSGRPYSVIQVQWTTPQVGGVSTTLFTHFLESFAVTARCNLHARLLYGMDDHHKAEALFKGLGRALDLACRLDSRRGDQIPSTKGSL